jgi:outer membrane protein assembly factor BamB
MRLFRQISQIYRVALSLIFMICIVSFPILSPRFFVYAAAASVSIKLSQTSGPPTSFTKVTGKIFGAIETVNLLFDTKLDGSTTTSSTGAFTFSLKIPRTATPRTHTIKVIGQSSQHSATASFLVQTNWSQDGFDVAQTHFNPYENVISASNVSQLVTAWENNYTQAACGTPIVVNDRVFITADNFYALDAATGATIWSSSLFGSETAPAVVGGIIYLASDKLYE